MDQKTRTCRRCGGPYTLGLSPGSGVAFQKTAGGTSRGGGLPACPHCGASPQPLLHLARSNAIAALMALIALGVLIPAMVLPFMAMDALGQRRVASLLSGIGLLWDEGHALIAVVILLFSVVFPIAKLALILITTSALAPVSHRWRDRLHRFATFTGKYSLLDVLVLAILVVLVKFKGVAHVEVRVGTVLFCIAIVLSLAAGLCVNLKPVETDP